MTPALPPDWNNDWEDTGMEQAVHGSKTPSLASNSLESQGFMFDENNSGLEMENQTEPRRGNSIVEQMVARICVKPPDPSEVPMPPMEWLTPFNSSQGQGRPNGMENRNMNYSGGNKRFFDD